MSRLREASISDLDECVHLHMLSMPSGLLTRLGRGVVEAYYRMVFSSPGYTCLVSCVCDPDRAVGVTVLENPNPISRQGSVRLYASAAAAVLKRPHLLGSFVVESLSGLASRDSNHATVEYIYVHPDYRGNSIGHEMLLEVTRRSQQAGFQAVSTKTSNVHLQRHYERMFEARMSQQWRLPIGGRSSSILVWPTDQRRVSGSNMRER